MIKPPTGYSLIPQGSIMLRKGAAPIWKVYIYNDAQWDLFTSTTETYQPSDATFQSLGLAKGYITRLVKSTNGCGFGDNAAFYILIDKRHHVDGYGRCYDNTAHVYATA